MPKKKQIIQKCSVCGKEPPFVIENGFKMVENKPCECGGKISFYFE